MDRLTTVLEQVLGAQHRALARPKFKAPTFNGDGDVELFIAQFVEVAEANEWDRPTATLHLRESLKDGARDCGRARGLDDLFETLRARYGLTPREARSRLTGLRRDTKATLQEHAVEVSRLVGIAYRDIPDQQQAMMAVESFCGTLGNAALQRHLLAVNTQTLEEAVRAGNEFLAIKPYSAAVRTIDEEDKEIVATVKEAGPWEAMLKLIQELTKKIDKLQGPTAGPAGSTEEQKRASRPPRCWGCGKLGHVKTKCPTNSWEHEKTRDQGNAEGPQQ